MATASAAVQASAKELRQPKQLPAPNGDFYEVTELLNPEELATLNQFARVSEGKSRARHQQVLG